MRSGPKHRPEPRRAEKKEVFMEQTKRLLCGAAREDITPAQEQLPGLFGLMGTPYAGIIDTLGLRVIALADGDSRALIVGFDLDKAPEPAAWLPELAQHTGIPEQNILYLGTHTHSAPLTTVRPRERNGVSAEQRASMNRYEDMVHEKLLRAADRALAGMVPARMGCATGDSYINVNRNADFVFTDADGTRYPYVSQAPNWRAPVDRTVFVMKVESEDGRPLAFFVNYAVHCCMMFLNNFDGKGSMGISGDVAGNISRLMEEKYPGSVAVWSSGAAGDVNPLLFNAVFYPDPKDGRYVMEAFESWKTTKKMLDMLVGWHYADVIRTVEKIGRLSAQVSIASALEWSETPLLDTAEPYRIRLHVLRLGEVALYGVGGELYSSFGRLVRQVSPLQHTVVINHEASLIDDAGYIFDDDALRRAAQPAPIRHMVPGANRKVKPGCVGPSLEEHTRSLFEKVL
jgi:neutral ceramidase